VTDESYTTIQAENSRSLAGTLYISSVVSWESDINSQGLLWMLFKFLLTST